MPAARSRTPTTVDPNDYAWIVGRSFVFHERRPILTIGTRSWSRYSLGRLGCPHPAAAANLQRIITELGIKSIAQLANHVQQIGAYKDVGVTAYWTVIAILREAGYRVEAIHPEHVTHATIKGRARRVAARERPRLRKRRAGPPSQAADDSPTTVTH
jgi:hypothetical protein